MEFKNIDEFDPRTCIGGQIGRIERLISGIFRKHLKEHDITNSQLSLLFVLTRAKDCNQKQLAQIAVLEKSSLNRNLKRLFEKEYILKEEKWIINITEEGLIFVDKVIPDWKKAMDEIRAILNEDGEEAMKLISKRFLSRKS